MNSSINKLNPFDKQTFLNIAQEIIELSSEEKTEEEIDIRTRFLIQILKVNRNSGAITQEDVSNIIGFFLQDDRDESKSRNSSSKVKLLSKKKS